MSGGMVRGALAIGVALAALTAPERAIARPRVVARLAMPTGLDAPGHPDTVGSLSHQGVGDNRTSNYI